MLDVSRRPARQLPPAPRKRALAVVVTLLIVMALLLGALGGFYVWGTGAPGPSRQVSVTVPSGSTTSDIAALLHDRGLIRSSLMFRLLARFRHLGQGIEAGTYELSPSMILDQVFDALRKGPAPIPTTKLTIPEGFIVAQIATRAHDTLGIDGKAFLQLARSGRFSLPPYLPEGRPTLEGFLFPKTYEFREHPAAEQVIRTLLDQFREDAGALPWDNAAGLHVTPYQAVVIASMVEREARVPADRPKIARVIYNRLARGMPLQIDATVQYALPQHKPRLTYDDLKYPSPYNTYLHAGLPPTPISNPGIASLRAALQPARGDWLYFIVTDPDGRHAFTASYDEFLRLKAQVQGG